MTATAEMSPIPAPLVQAVADAWIAVQNAESEQRIAERAAARAADDAERTRLDLGRALLALKEQTPHGKWLPLLASLRIPPRNAQNYMRLAGYVEKNETAGDVSHSTPTYADAGIKAPKALDYKTAAETMDKAIQAAYSKCPPVHRAYLISQLEETLQRLREMPVTDPAMGTIGKAKSEFLAAPARPPLDDGAAPPRHGGWTNEAVIEAATGRLSGADPALWDPVRVRYGSTVDTFDTAFHVLARAAEYRWDRFDLETLRECRGLATLQPVPRMLEPAIEVAT